jgi:hypothetical protein
MLRSYDKLYMGACPSEISGLGAGMVKGVLSPHTEFERLIKLESTMSMRCPSILPLLLDDGISLKNEPLSISLCLIY